MSEQLVAEAATYAHTQHKGQRPCPQRDWNPRSQWLQTDALDRDQDSVIITKFNYNEVSFYFRFYLDLKQSVED
jgi:hypothetical protein